MRKILLWCAVALLGNVAVQAQTIQRSNRPVDKHGERCYTPQRLEELRAQLGVNAETDAQFESWINRKIAEKKSSPQTDVINNYTIPVIFHVIYDAAGAGGAVNVSADLIKAQLAQLNKDYANLSGSPYGVSSTTGIQFCMATQDINGVMLAEPGIHRVNRTSLGLGTAPYTTTVVDQTIKPNTIYQADFFLNIWVVPHYSPSVGTLLGYATFPTSSGLSGISSGETATTAGVVIDPSTVGSIVTPNGGCGATANNMGKTLVHELGHFFGLRHIWGDGTCATDYVDDTPTHETANYGTFSHPKGNTCGTADEMFENYMDYTDDEQLNTFTLKQVDRMQIVMNNSPRRNTLASGFISTSCLTANKVAFFPCFGIDEATETANVNGCPAYKDVRILLAVEDRATAAATINLVASGNAVNGVDYQLLQTSIPFAAGEGSKYVTVRILDDGIVETLDSLVLNFTITGTGLTAASTTQSYKLYIIDDDAVKISNNRLNILAENFNVSPLQSGTWGSLSNTSPNTWAITTDPANTFGSRFAYITNNTGQTGPFPYTYSAGAGGSAANVLRTPLVNTTGYKDLQISFRYACQGEVSAGTAVDYGRLTFSYGTAPSTFYFLGNPLVNTPAPTTLGPLGLIGFDNLAFHFGFYFLANTNTTLGQPPLGVDDVLFTGFGTKIESSVNSSKTINLAAGVGNPLTSVQDAEIIATINPSTAINCVTATVQQAGNTQVNITTDIGTYKRTEKVIKISPASPSTATYTATLYFSAAELNVWGGLIPTLKVLKVNDATALTSTLTSSNATLITPAFGDSSAKGYYTYTFTTTGFSQFMLVDPTTALPVRLLDFSVKANTQSIGLNWSTTNETMNKGFGVERSVNGVDFGEISFVTGKGQTPTGGNYTYSLDDQNVRSGITYFYRLRQVDLDGKVTYSPIRSAKIGDKAGFVVFPNPVKNKTRIIADKNTTASIEVFDAKGSRIIAIQRQLITANGYELSLEKQPAGVYMIRVSSSDKTENFSVIKE